MARVAYIAVLLVALGSVAFGLDWLPAPMAPMLDSRFAVNQPAVSPVPVPVSRTDGPNAAPSPAFPVGPSPPAAAPTRPQTVGAQTILASEAPQRACNVNACANAYQSFQASDCSYQPLNGPRRRCSKK